MAVMSVDGEEALINRVTIPVPHARSSTLESGVIGKGVIDVGDERESRMCFATVDVEPLAIRS